ncbi:conserved hypothetical protein [Histoplasma capsulatum var. duboisii H88]|uniref:Uncharacterized protein n=2 Tax=Ajellomyces capsulatus TaxID=5037 RepID=F0UBE0_AJEC8|nr:conserved hypothetical protein [Histoplasma capsulatum H143]EGC43049.1 conserved hypothetical protein [Histoplasma capsulatum var. duboisii H88]
MKLFVAIVFDLMISAIASRISVSEAMKGLEHDPNGLVDIGDDGILRSFDSRGTVIDYRRLTTDELHSLSKDFVKGNDERLLAMWANVDSSLVDEEQIWNPRQDYIKQFVSEAATGRLKSRAMRDSLLSPREPHCTDYTCWSHSECEGHDQDELATAPPGQTLRSAMHALVSIGLIELYDQEIIPRRLRERSQESITKTALSDAEGANPAQPNPDTIHPLEANPKPGHFLTIFWYDSGTTEKFPLETIADAMEGRYCKQHECREFLASNPKPFLLIPWLCSDPEDARETL